MNLCDAPMPSWCKGHVVVELNYPHIIGFSGYERHHDVATGSPRFCGEPEHNQKTCTNRANRASQTVTAKLRVNNGEARADHRSRPDHPSRPDYQPRPDY